MPESEGQKDGRLQCGGRPSLLLCPAVAAAAVSVAGELRDTANCPGKGGKEGEEGLERLFGRSLGKKTAALQDRRRRDVLNGADTRTPWTGHIPLGLRFIHDAVVVGRGEGGGGVAQRGGRKFEAAAGTQNK